MLCHHPEFKEVLCGTIHMDATKSRIAYEHTINELINLISSVAYETKILIGCDANCNLSDANADDDHQPVNGPYVGDFRDHGL